MTITFSLVLKNSKNWIRAQFNLLPSRTSWSNN